MPTHIINHSSAEALGHEGKPGELHLFNVKAEIWSVTSKAQAGKKTDIRAKVPMFSAFSYKSDSENSDLDGEMPQDKIDALRRREEEVLANSTIEDDDDEDGDEDFVEGDDDPIEDDSEADFDHTDDLPNHFDFYGIVTTDPDAMLRTFEGEGQTVEDEKKRVWWMKHGGILQLNLETPLCNSHSSYNLTKEEANRFIGALRAGERPNGQAPNMELSFTFGEASAFQSMTVYTVAGSREILPSDHPLSSLEGIDDDTVPHVLIVMTECQWCNMVKLAHPVARAIADHLESILPLLPD